MILPEEPIKLTEHENEQNTKLTRGELEEGDKAILKELKRKGWISHTFDEDGGGGGNDHLLITTKDYAGSFQLPGVGRRIDIIPKMFKKQKDWKNTNEFLNFAHHGTMDYFEGKSIVKLGDESVLMNRMYDQLMFEYDELWREGLLKSYVLHAENSSSMRGKILFQHQMLNDAMLRPKFFCEFDELEYDSPENRVILQALTIVERMSDVSETKMVAMDHAQRLSGVVEKVVVAAPERQRMMERYNRQTYRYEQIHRTCDDIIRNAGIEDIYSGDIRRVAPKLYDMDREFERFVEELFINYGGFESDNLRFQKDEVSWEGQDVRDRTMKPDITIWDDDKCKKIIDVKYKKDKTLPASDLYQLGFYMHEYGKGQIKDSFAIALESDMQKETVRYTATKSKSVVFVKRLNVAKCLDIIRNDDKAKMKELIDWLVLPSTEPFDYG